jgi:hypothetical protein
MEFSKTFKKEVRPQWSDQKFPRKDPIPEKKPNIYESRPRMIIMELPNFHVNSEG